MSTQQSSNLTPEELERTWQRALHEDNLFNERLNFFLVFHSVLIAVAATLLNTPTPRRESINLIIMIGLIMSIVWLYVQARQWLIIEVLVDQVKPHFREYQVYDQLVKCRRWFGITTSTRLIAFLIPILVAILWLVLLLY